MPPENSWKEWSKYVLAELKRLNGCYEVLGKEMKAVSIQIAMLKVKSGVWGAVGASIPIIIGLAFWIAQRTN